MNAFFETGYVDAAMKTALHLREYEDIIDPVDIYSLLGKNFHKVYLSVLRVLIVTQRKNTLNYRLRISHLYIGYSINDYAIVFS